MVKHVLKAYIITNHTSNVAARPLKTDESSSCDREMKAVAIVPTGKIVLHQMSPRCSLRLINASAIAKYEMQIQKTPKPTKSMAAITLVAKIILAGSA